jgi:hypothetical protein
VFTTNDCCLCKRNGTSERQDDLHDAKREKHYSNEPKGQEKNYVEKHDGILHEIVNPQYLPFSLHIQDTI